VKIYLAARYDRRHEMREVAVHLQRLGHEIGSRWIWSDIADDSGGETEASLFLEKIALEDMKDLLQSEAIISFTEAPSAIGAVRGGRHVEFGMAAAWGKRLIVVGPRENIFHHLHDVEVFGNLDELLRSLVPAPVTAA